MCCINYIIYEILDNSKGNCNILLKKIFFCRNKSLSMNALINHLIFYEDGYHKHHRGLHNIKNSHIYLYIHINAHIYIYIDINLTLILIIDDRWILNMM